MAVTSWLQILSNSSGHSTAPRAREHNARCDSNTAKEDAYHQAVNERSRLKAAIESDRFAVERLREDARRANVPPGWLRWP